MTAADDLALLIAIQGACALTWLTLKYRATQRAATRKASKEQTCDGRRCVMSNATDSGAS